jgi:hypothetical protein
MFVEWYGLSAKGLNSKHVIILKRFDNGDPQAFQTYS